LGSDFFVATELRPAAAGPLRNLASLEMAVLERRISDNPKVVRLRELRTVAQAARNTRRKDRCPAEP
jgi:hypothetical protein